MKSTQYYEFKNLSPISQISFVKRLSKRLLAYKNRKGEFKNIYETVCNDIRKQTSLIHLMQHPHYSKPQLITYPCLVEQEKANKKGIDNTLERIFKFYLEDSEISNIAKLYIKMNYHICNDFNNYKSTVCQLAADQFCEAFAYDNGPYDILHYNLKNDLLSLHDKLTNLDCQFLELLTLYFQRKIEKF